MHNNQWISAAHTDIGTVRKINEDDCLDASNVGMWCVADGMGGHEKGDVASSMIIDHLRDLNNPALFPITAKVVEQRLQSVNNKLLQLADSLPSSSVIGSTVAVLFFDAQQAHCLWAGDSRIYRLRGGQLERLTRDHSQVEDMVDAGIISAEEAERHPAANVITRAVGAHEELELELRSFDLAPGDRFLLCSDGLNKVLGDPELQQILIHQPLQSAPHTLIQHALNGQARDNVTVVTVHYEGNNSHPNTDYELDATLPLRR